MFQRPTPVREANAAVKALANASRLYIKDEGSETALLYGNKIRKFEFLLPNLAFAGVEKVSTHGGIGSNHCAYLALAARYGAYGPAGAPTIKEVELMLYPQEITENVMTKLRLLVASGARLNFLEGDASVGLSILTEQLKTRNAEAGTAAYVPPGGSSPLTVLAHVEALMELAQQVESGACALSTPPDYIFVPLGSGATAMGLVLGCHLLGWPTKVVGTCSQDKSRIARLVVNGDINTPFLVKNAELLLARALKWVDAMGLRSGARSAVSSRDILRESFAYDNETWHPEFGKATPEVEREAATAAEAGLVLDSTFTAKSFHTLGLYAARGWLKNTSALFWNTYQRFPLNTLLPEDRDWMLALPESMRASVDAYASSRSAG
jgi:1-aminocyclopropane-1-carboxylate deaminase/D-cysteine desulfhydrase-like pyridoxal-dependent ACC family enzyme